MLDYYKYKQVADLYKQNRSEEAHHLLVQMQNTYISICDENSMLKTRIQELEDILHMAKNLVFDESCYWLMTGSIKQGPFCQRCYMREGALIRLDIQDNEWTCNVCGVSYNRPAYVERLKARKAPTLAKVIPFSH